MRATGGTGQTVACRALASSSGDSPGGVGSGSSAGSSGGQAPVPVNGGTYVYLLEDDEDQAQLVQHWLRLDGVPCRWFRTASELYAGLHVTPQAGQQANRPRLLLCDWQLAETNADTVLATLAGDGALPCPVVVMSAHTDPARHALALQAGASAWLTKPVARGALRDIIATYG